MRARWDSSLVHVIASRTRPDRLRNLHPRARRYLAAERVDAVTGAVLLECEDARSLGAVHRCFRFVRCYASSWSHRAGSMGHGWSHAYDQCVWQEPGRLVWRSWDGREVEFDTFDFDRHVLPSQEGVTDKLSGVRVRCVRPGVYRLTLPDQRVLAFEPGKESPAVSWLTVVTAPHEQSTRVSRDARGRIERVTDAAGRVCAFRHDPHGRLVELRLLTSTNASGESEDGDGVVLAQFAYDPRGDLVAAVDADGGVQRYQYEDHLLVREIDRTAFSRYYGYDDVGSAARCIRTWADGGAFDTHLEYFPSECLSLVTDARGYVRRVQANPIHLLFAVTGVGRWTYDKHLRVLSVADRAGRTTRYERDTDGNITAVVLPDGARITVERNARGQAVAMLDRLGHRWERRWDEWGALVEQVDPQGHCTRWEWDHGVVRAEVTPSGVRTERTLNRAGQVTAMRVDVQPVRAFGYDLLGRLVSARVGDAPELVVRRDPRGWIAEVVTPEGAQWRIKRDAEGRIVSAWSDTRTVHFRHAPGRGVSERTEGDGTIEVRYDPCGGVTAVKLESGCVWEFRRGKDGAVSAETTPDGAVWKYVWNVDGTLKRVDRPDRTSTRFVYDAFGRAVLARHSDRTHDAFVYREDGALVEAGNGRASVVFSRDVFGRVVREHTGALHVRMRRDHAGRLIEITSSLGARHAFVRRADGATEAACIGDPNAYGWRVNAVRNARGMVMNLKWPGGVEQRFDRDPAMRPRGMWIGRAGKDLLAHAYRWERNVITTVMRPGRGAVTLTRDARDRLVQMQVGEMPAMHRGFDPHNNVHRAPDASDRVYVHHDRLARIGERTFEHDPLGRLIAVRENDTPVWTFRYDVHGQLVEARGPDGLRVAYTYDPMGRRVSREENGATERFVWAGRVVLHALHEHAPPVTWLFDPDAFVPLAREQDDVHTSVLCDTTGTPVRAFDATGAPVWKAEMRLHGERLAEGAVPVPWRWPGMHEDSAIGWSYNGARWYWPAVGRYTTPAITGIAAGLERYHHVDDPWVHRKPDGETVVTTVEDELELRTRDLVPVALRCHERVHDAAFLSLRDPSRDPALAPLRDVLSSNGPAVLDARVPLGADVGPWSLVREPALPVELTGPRIAW